MVEHEGAGVPGVQGARRFPAWTCNPYMSGGRKFWFGQGALFPYAGP